LSLCNHASKRNDGDDENNRQSHGWESHYGQLEQRIKNETSDAFRFTLYVDLEHASILTLGVSFLSALFLQLQAISKFSKPTREPARNTCSVSQGAKQCIL
jgi:hypothetical protein